MPISVERISGDTNVYGYSYYGTAIPFGGDIFLTAAHVFNEYRSNSDGKGNTNYTAKTAYVYVGNQPYGISVHHDAHDFDPNALAPGKLNSTTITHDISYIEAPGANVTGSDLTSVVAFADLDQVQMGMTSAQVHDLLQVPLQRV